MRSLDIAQKTYVLNELNVENLSMIKDGINHSTRQVESNFEANIDLLKQIREKVSDDAIAEQLSVVLFNMHNYISILQCEDKLFQMLDGVSNILNASNSQIADEVEILSDENKIQKIKESTVEFYTIQDQRDLALNVEPCDVEDSELTLF